MIFKSNSPKNHRRIEFFNYLLGFLVGSGSLIVLIFFLFNINLKNRYADKLEYFKVAFFGKEASVENDSIALAVIPGKRVLDELTQKKAVFDNLRDLTGHGVGAHKSFAVEEDSLVGYKLRPNITVNAYYLKSIDRYDNDPPLLYLDGHLDYSNNIKNYLKKSSFMKYSFTTDRDGYRTTIPKISAKKKVLIVGDSVAFGLGVDDKYTLASQLQLMLGDSYQVINAGVSGYETNHILASIDKLKNKHFDHLIYVVCVNDFPDLEGPYIDDFRNLIKELRPCQSAFNQTSLVLSLYINQTIPNYFKPETSKTVNRQMKKLNHWFSKIEHSENINFFNWYTIADEFQKKEKTFFAKFSLYADRIHLSRKGNYELAKAIYQRIFRE